MKRLTFFHLAAFCFLLSALSIDTTAQRRQLKWANVMLPGTANTFAGWNATGDATELTGTQATALLSTFSSSAKGVVPASGGGTVSFLRADGVWSPIVGVTDGDKGDITVSGTGATWTIDPQAVTYSKIQNISATSRFLGRITTGAGVTEELTGTQATTLLDNFTSTLKGLTPASGGGTVNFLRADGGWTPALTGTMAAANIPFGADANSLTQELAFSYLTATNQLHIIGTTGQYTTDIFGGEIQLDDVTNTYDVTLNNAGLTSTRSGTADFNISSNTGLTFTGDITIAPVSAASQIYSGIYNPAGTAVTNVTTVLPVNDANFSRVGNVVTVSGLVTITPTTGGAESIFRLSLPIPSAFTSTVNCAGVATGRENDASTVQQMPARILADITNDEAQFNFLPLTSGTAGDVTLAFQFTYRVM